MWYNVSTGKSCSDAIYTKAENAFDALLSRARGSTEPRDVRTIAGPTESTADRKVPARTRMNASTFHGTVQSVRTLTIAV